MEQINTPWQASRQQYNELLEKLNTLINETAQALEFYQQTNMNFAYHLYSDDLIPLMEKAGCFKAYGAEFSTVHAALQEQVGHLKKFRDKIYLMTIRDGMNCPTN